MSDDQGTQDTISPAVVPPAIELTDPAPQDPQQQEPVRPQSNGYAPPVDLSNLPPEMRGPLENRFKHLSGLMKKNESKYDSELRQWREVAEAQSKQIEELTTGMSTVVDHLQTTNFATVEAQIRQQMREAQQSGNSEAFFDLQDKLIDIRTEKKLAEKQQKQPPQKPAAQSNGQQQQINTADVVEAAIKNGEMTREDANVWNAWQRERDEGGMPVRSWANPADPRFREAFVETQSVFTNQRFANLPFDQKLAEVDKRMGLNRNTTAQTVMGGNLTMPRKNAKMTLSPEQEQIAVRMKLGGPKAKSDADHIEKYRQQLAKIKTKGTRS